MGTQILACPAGDPPQTSAPPLIQIWQMQKMTLPAIEEQKSPQLNRVEPLCQEHQGLQLKRLLQRWPHMKNTSREKGNRRKRTKKNLIEKKKQRRKRREGKKEKKEERKNVKERKR